MSKLQTILSQGTAFLLALLMLSRTGCGVASDDEVSNEQDQDASTGIDASQDVRRDSRRSDDSGGSEMIVVTDSWTARPTMQISGKVMAPNGKFPISGALVYLAEENPPEIPSGAFHYECDEMAGTPYTLSLADGTWTIPEAPYGKWKLITRKGNFRRVRDIEIKEGTDPIVPQELTTLPGKNNDDGTDRVPSFAVVKTEPDVVHLLLGKFGMATIGGNQKLVPGTESFAIFDDSNKSSGPNSWSYLLKNTATLSKYHMVFLPCYFLGDSDETFSLHAPHIRAYVAAGGRIYNTCMANPWTETAFPKYIRYSLRDVYDTKGTINDAGLLAWMNVVSPSSLPKVPITDSWVMIDRLSNVNDGHGLPSDNGVVKPFTWVTDISRYPNKPMMVTYNYDFGKVFYSVYQTSNGSPTITPQEYILLYVILEVGVCSNPPPPPPPPK